MEKKFYLQDGNIIYLQILDAYCGKSIHITKAYFESGELVKDFSLSMWDDYGFNAWINKQDDDINEVIFDIPVDDPLFFCFYRFLDNEEAITIYCDETSDSKFFTVRKKEDEGIELIFTSEMIRSQIDKFSILVKNICFDLRSRIDCEGKDTKKRLHNFFKEAIEVLQEDYHQVTIDEYILKRKLNRD